MVFLNKSYARKVGAAFLSFALVITINSVAVAESKNVTNLLSRDRLILAQVYRRLNFDSNYYQQLSQADNFYRKGELDKAKEIQQRVKPGFNPKAILPPAFDSVNQLDARGQEYWRAANSAIEANPETAEEITSQIFLPLQKLVKENPGFIPGHILLADTHDLYREEKQALAAIEKASEMYPDREDVLDTKIDLLLLYGKPLEASIAAREFAFSNPNHPKTKAYEQAANSYFDEYRKKLNNKVTTSGILGTIGQVATGNEVGALQIVQALSAGEAAAGQSFAQSIKAQSKMVNSPPPNSLNISTISVRD